MFLTFCRLSLLLDNTVVGEDEVRRFNACMHAERSRAGNPHVALIEKTTINAMRIPMLHALSPESPLLHLVRNGIDVIRSINRLASTNTYQIRGKGEWNQWWGRDHCKWKALAADAIAHEHFANEIEHVSTNTEMGAIEWLISLREIEKQRVALGRRLIDVRYNDLTSNPAIQLERICSHFDIPSKAAWLKHSSAKLDPARKNKGEPVILPPKMCEAFNHFQQQYGFEGEATCR